jgi:hypothetical protein
MKVSTSIYKKSNTFPYLQEFSKHLNNFVYGLHESGCEGRHSGTHGSTVELGPHDSPHSKRSASGYLASRADLI